MGAVRWRIALVLSIAIAISYLDRQALSIAIAAIQHEIPLTNTDFSRLQIAFLAAYGLMYAGGGALIDWLGTRRGFVVIMIWWSLACAGHGLAQGFDSLALSRFLLGVGEGGGFPAATKAVAEWFPARERSTAMGIINAGTAVGAVIAPPLLAAIILTANWRWAFIVCGLAGLVMDGVVGARILPAGPASARSRRPNAQTIAEVFAAPASNEPAMSWASLLARASGLGARAGEVPHRRRVVLLPLLAAEVSLRCPRLRREAGRLLRLDSLRRRRRRQPDRRLVLELAADARPLHRCLAQNCARPERGGDAAHHLRHPGPGRARRSSSSASRSSASSHGRRS